MVDNVPVIVDTTCILDELITDIASSVMATIIKDCDFNIMLNVCVSCIMVDISL